MKTTLHLHANRVRGTAAGIILGCAMLALAGCAASSTQQGPINPSLPVGLPPAVPPASSNTFTGTQSPGLWSLTVDDTQAQFEYQSVSYPPSPNVPTAGSFLQVLSFNALKNANTNSAGYMVEVPGRAALIEPGDDTTGLVFSIAANSCLPINGNVDFQFVEMPSANPTQQVPAYGFIAAQSSADGSSWSFGAQQQYALPYNQGTPQYNTLHGLSPILPGTSIGNALFLPTFTATCAVSNGNATIAAGSNVLSARSNSTLPTTFVVGPTGFFFADESATQPPTGTNFTPGSFAGMIQPSAPLSTASVVAPKYVGFIREARNGVSLTSPIGFGQIIAGSGTSMTGGTFLNDDITQFQNSNIVLNLGSQDPANNGLYSLATITMADPGNACYYDGAGHQGAEGTPGVDQFGNETCTFNVVAVAGNPENKYAIFLYGLDVISGNPMGIYLFQQQ